MKQGQLSTPADILMENFNPYNSANKLNWGLNCPLEYLQVYMTALILLLLIAMISIDCKITNFSLHLFYTVRGLFFMMTHFHESEAS